MVILYKLLISGINKCGAHEINLNDEVKQFGIRIDKADINYYCDNDKCV